MNLLPPNRRLPAGTLVYTTHPLMVTIMWRSALGLVMAETFTDGIKNWSDWATELAIHPDAYVVRRWRTTAIGTTVQEDRYPDWQSMWDALFT